MSWWRVFYKNVHAAPDHSLAFDVHVEDGTDQTFNEMTVKAHSLLETELMRNDEENPEDAVEDFKLSGITHLDRCYECGRLYELTLHHECP